MLKVCVRVEFPYHPYVPEETPEKLQDRIQLQYNKVDNFTIIPFLGLMLDPAADVPVCLPLSICLISHLPLVERERTALCIFSTHLCNRLSDGTL